MRRWPLKWRPYFEAWVDFGGLLQVQTLVMRECFYRRTVEYLALEVRFLSRGFRFRLYDTQDRRY